MLHFLMAEIRITIEWYDVAKINKRKINEVGILKLITHEAHSLLCVSW